MEPKEVTAFGKSPRTVKARALLCFWAHRKLGMTTVKIAKKLSICQSAASRLSMRGERFANEHKIELVDTKT
jgi:putative transposase